MAEFMEVMRQANRMCASYEGCDNCLAFDVCVFDECAVKNYRENRDHEKFEHVVMNWATEHPESQYPTWREWWEENFPTADMGIMPCTFASNDELGCGKNRCDECKARPIPADIAKKLGIKPKED